MKQRIIKVEIIETLSRIVEVMADDEETALAIVKDRYTDPNNENYIILDSEDFIDYELNIFED